MSQLRGSPDILEEAGRRGARISQPGGQCANALGGRPASLLGCRQARAWEPALDWKPEPVGAEARIVRGMDL